MSVVVHYAIHSGPIASTLENLSQRRGIHKVLLSENQNVNKILALQEYIINANYLLNSQFISNIVSNHLNEIQIKNINVSSSFSNQHWTVEFNQNNKNSKSNVSFDIVDGFGNDYGRFRTFKEFGSLHGLSKYEIDKVAADIDIFVYCIYKLYHM